MITRELKLKLTKQQEELLNTQLFQCSGLYNLIIRRIKLSAENKIYYSKYELFNQFSGHSKKTDLHSRTIQAVIEQAYVAWERCFKKIAKEPKLKSVRNKLTSVPFPDPIKKKQFQAHNRVRIPTLGSVKFSTQELPDGNIKYSRVIKRASGWYLSLHIDAKHSFKVKVTDEKVGIDTGIKELAILSNGVRYSNEKYYAKSQKRLAQAQRGKRKKQAARISEKIKNQRKDYNHKVSKEIVQNYKEIYITNDNLKGQARKFGKSVNDAGISQLRQFILYKSDNHDRVCKLIESKNTTMTCSACSALTGPTGLSGLAVRSWECSVCGTHHDRDKNSAVNILNSGLGISLVQFEKTG